MNKDRLENIKEIYQASDTAWADDIRTLVKEVERLQQAHTTVVEHYNIACSENERLRERLAEVVNIYPEMEQITNYKATIATLRDRLSYYANRHKVTKHPGEKAYCVNCNRYVDDECDNAILDRKALDPAQEKK